MEKKEAAAPAVPPHSVRHIDGVMHIHLHNSAPSAAPRNPQRTPQASEHPRN
ncbi:MAG: hypothetical protein VKN33_00660 [Candidatus Sericytochromatia bacterium]|nr:hypothetical protein [Candidatus Sericytochromatia bacterium]